MLDQKNPLLTTTKSFIQVAPASDISISLVGKYRPVHKSAQALNAG
ncbi:MAG: hypothetical protein LBC61_04110 [Candidatus Peribacteria bacterium]|nr:hypothetical protein [Candidatus Peribacteria bacterium]